MNRDEMSNHYRGPSIDATYQVLIHLAEGFQRRRLKCEKLTDDRRRIPSDDKSSLCLWQGELKMELVGITSFFNFYTKLAESFFLCCFRVESVNVFVLPQFDLCHVHIFFINKQFRTCANAFSNEFTVRSYEYCAVKHWYFTGCKKIKQRRISYVLGYLRMILWKISTAISIKHRILATFNIKKIQFWQPVCL